ncbi:synaptotagmin-15 [Salvelinus fontinalis]|uniref:synaptotagmin-15 n=1 Tax=Salvelinus fontinalis TaxID=8038 RepID=UPI0024859ECD|nr:synaptotagmin-15 [Salvelinus fontinalis]
MHMKDYVSIWHCISDPTMLLAVGLSLGLFLLLLIGVSVYFLWRRCGQRRYQEMVTMIAPFPACTTPILLTNQRPRYRPDEIPFFLPPRFKPNLRSEEGEKEGRKDLSSTHRGSLTVGSWYPVGSVRASLYWIPDVSEMSPPPGRAVRLCFSVTYRHDNEQLYVSLLRLSNLPTCFYSNDTLADLRLLPDDRRRHKARARCRGRDPEFNDSFVFQVSGVCVSESVLSVYVLSVDRGGRHHAVGRVLFPIEGELGEGGRLLWRDLETKDEMQCSGLGDIQVSLNYSPSLQRLTVVILRARSLQIHTDTGVCFQVSLKIHTRVVKSRRTPVVSSGAEHGFNHKMTFKLRPAQLDQTCLILELIVSGLTPVGVVVLGPFMYARGPQLQHWTDMVNTPNELVKQWHGLGKPT